MYCNVMCVCVPVCLCISAIMFFSTKASAPNDLSPLPEDLHGGRGVLTQTAARQKLQGWIPG